MESQEGLEAEGKRPKDKRPTKIDKPYALIRCAGRRDPTEPLSVDVGVNGKAYSLQRGMYVPVPEEVVEVLNNAECPYYVEEEGSDRKVFAGMQKRYPFEVIGWLTEDQYQALKVIATTPGRKITDDDIIEIRARR